MSGLVTEVGNPVRSEMSQPMAITSECLDSATSRKSLFVSCFSKSPNRLCAIILNFRLSVASKWPRHCVCFSTCANKKTSPGVLYSERRFCFAFSLFDIICLPSNDSVDCDVQAHLIRTSCSCVCCGAGCCGERCVAACSNRFPT